MSLFRRRKRREPDAITGSALVSLYGSEAVEAVHVSWDGEVEAINFLVPAYFDKILFNLVQMPREQLSLLDRVEAFSEEQRGRLTYGSDVFAAVGMARLAATRPQGSPFAEIEVNVAIIPEMERAAAATEFRPIHATTERVAELGLWMLWDWSLAMGDEGVAGFLLDCLHRQSRYYRQFGMPRLSELGEGPFAAVMSVLDPQPDPALHGRNNPQ